MITLRAPAFWLAAAVLAAGAGCGERPPPVVGDDGWGPSLRGGEVAVNEDAPPAPRARPLPPAERARWARADEIAGLTQVGGRDRSEHLDGAYERTVLVDAAASGYGQLTTGTRFSPGALVVQRHHEGDDRVVAIYAMERLAEGTAPAARDWRFWVLDPSLRVAAVDVALCARCHAEAPFRGLFGPPAAP